ncbi:MAG: DJ-1/PfpI family protein, partial [Paucibacter sp.]|nr:DJ-1/PfpI family protein [Roseateles sp.]
MSRFVRVVWAALASAALAFSNVQADTAIVPDAAAAVVAADKIAPYLPRFGRQRPVVAVLGENSNTVLTDFVVPYGVLAQSGVADVVSIGTTAGPLQLRPALRIVPDETMASFDQRFPQGADYVVVPAIGKRGYGPEGAWLTAQVAKGATIVSICDGVQVVADAGLLKGRRATGHWASYANRVAAHPDTQWVTNARYVVDGRFVSSAGISAALPTALALVEAIGGTERAKAFAVTLGVDNWSTQHDSDAFKLGFGVKVTHWVNMNLHSTQ